MILLVELKEIDKHVAGDSGVSDEARKDLVAQPPRARGVPVEIINPLFFTLTSFIAPVENEVAWYHRSNRV